MNRRGGGKVDNRGFSTYRRASSDREIRARKGGSLKASFLCG